MVGSVRASGHLACSFAIVVRSVLSSARSSAMFLGAAPIARLSFQGCAGRVRRGTRELGRCRGLQARRDPVSGVRFGGFSLSDSFVSIRKSRCCCGSGLTSGVPRYQPRRIVSVLHTDTGRHRVCDAGSWPGPAERLGLPEALRSLPWLGFVPDRVADAPTVPVARLAEQLGVDALAIRSHGKRAQTRTEHLRLVAQYLGWRQSSAMTLKELDDFLLARAMEHDSPTLLFRLACEYLLSAKVIRPSPDTVVRRVVHARERALRETYDRVAHELTEHRCAELAALGPTGYRPLRVRDTLF